eukprot:m.548599 g.548599  ORF g.548599 m.548599 type:complete len:527 (-) comp22158_c1_seq68:2838-4418(-)
MCREAEGRDHNMVGSMLSIACVSALVAQISGAPQRTRDAVNALPLVAYVSNQGEFRPKPYTHSVSSLGPVAHMFNAFIYGPLLFEDETFSIISTNARDSDNYHSLIELKKFNEDLKVLFTVGGKHFPSHMWSLMSSSASYRDGFINSVSNMKSIYSFDGIEIDWVYPCSPERTIWEQFDSVDFRKINDTGGVCPNDRDNLVQLLKELRTAMGEDFIISLALGIDAEEWADTLSGVEPYVDFYFVKAYDYHVSADPVTKGADKTSPAQPIADSNNEWGGKSVSATVEAYQVAGIPPYKMSVILPAYGQTYYIPTIDRNPWDQLGFPAKISGSCYGPYEDTYGAFPSDATRVCGQLTYAEIIRGIEDGMSPAQDSNTRSDMAFLPSKLAFISFTGNSAVRSLVDVVSSQKCGGVGINSIDMDTFNDAQDRHDYELGQAVCNELFGDNQKCSIRAKTTTPAPEPGKDCIGRQDGTYCLPTFDGFIICPQNVTESCPAGTVCKQNTSTAIACDWPNNHYLMVSEVRKRRG